MIEALLSSSVPRAAWLGGSDAHTAPRIATVYTAAPGGSKGEFLDSVRRGDCAILGTAPGLAALVRDVYIVIGEFYARLSARRLASAAVATALVPAVLSGLPALLTVLAAARQEWIGWGIDTSRAHDQNPLLASKP